MEYWSAPRRNGVLIQEATWMDPENALPITGDHTAYDPAHVKCPQEANPQRPSAGAAFTGSGRRREGDWGFFVSCWKGGGITQR